MSYGVLTFIYAYIHIVVAIAGKVGGTSASRRRRRRRQGQTDSGLSQVNASVAEVQDGGQPEGNAALSGMNV